ncbi:hypothetical protein CHS0354_002058 [Potamilus streckersoni]|uniref:Protein kinase domain-containing protein n=1 Tax=Potamilus streckersoni TaxID=2493646 RepID=A0AAE0T5J4_9BIVA|nr:hypothetical protein CHS0354_002058 [Potamilus streckersoni]
MEKTALLTDIHANLEALQACIRHAEERDVKRFVFMGDLVGYGADPAAVLNTVMRFAAEGHAVLLGNHGEAVLSVPRFFNEVAREAVLWTQRQLLEMHLNFLRSLPLFVSPDEDVFISHSGAWEPEKWHYVDDEMLRRAHSKPALMQLRPGGIIDNFMVGERLFSGGTAYLYRVTHPDYDFPLLMKVPRLGPDQPTAAMISFETECMIMPRLYGPHCPRCVGVGNLQSIPYIVFEQVEGVQLTDLIKHEGMTVEQTVQIGISIAKACHALHRQDVLHLDIKPDNIILKDSGDVVLIDFGFSCHHHLPDLFQEEQRSAVGSPPYIAPEQVMGIRNNAKSDQFALGVTLYEMLTGQLPYGFPETQKEMESRIWLEVTPPRSLRPDCPPWLQEIILTCLRIDPNKRFATSALIANALNYPDTVTLTELASRQVVPGFWQQIKATWRRQQRVSSLTVKLKKAPSIQINHAPLILAAVDINHPDVLLQDAVGEAVNRALRRHPHSRLTCLSIVTNNVGEESAESSESVRHHQTLQALQRWVRRSELPEERCTLHVFEDSDPAGRIVKYAVNNHVDVIIVGGTRKQHYLLGLGRSNMTRIVEEAPCSVHIIRVPL